MKLLSFIDTEAATQFFPVRGKFVTNLSSYRWTKHLVGCSLHFFAATVCGRSNNHISSVLDEWTPSALQAKATELVGSQPLCYEGVVVLYAFSNGNDKEAVHPQDVL